MVWMIVSIAWAACDPVAPGEIEDAIRAAEQAFAAADVAGFEALSNRALALPSCVYGAVPRSTAAALHRLAGLRAFVRKEQSEAELAFAAARRLEPAYAFPTTLVPSGHKIRTWYDAIQPIPDSVALLPEPAKGSLVVDGEASRERPAVLPAVVQLTGTGGKDRGGYFRPQDDLFAYKAKDPAPLPTSAAAPAPPTAAPARERKGPHLPLAVSCAVAAVLTGGAGVLAARADQEYWDRSTPEGDLDGLRVEVNALSAAAIGFGAVAVGTGVASITLGRW